MAKINFKEMLIIGASCVLGIIILHYFFHVMDWIFEWIIDFSGLWTLLFIFLFGCAISYLMQHWPEDSKF